MTGGIPTQRASKYGNAKNVSIWWRHHGVKRREYMARCCFQEPLMCFINYIELTISYDVTNVCDVIWYHSKDNINGHTFQPVLSNTQCVNHVLSKYQTFCSRVQKGIHLTPVVVGCICKSLCLGEAPIRRNINQIWTRVTPPLPLAWCCRIPTQRGTLTWFCI